MVRLLLLLIAAAVPFIAGCSTFGYYMQSIGGELKLLSARAPIPDLIADPSTPPALKARLERVTEIREFASRELQLPDNPSYRSYVDLKRPFVVWNIFAAGEFSIEPKKWCFLFVGCVGYRGYFAQNNAEAYASDLRGEGLDVFVGGVPAFSTLGWFSDPVLNTFIGYPDYRLARLIFHELAHQIAYVKGDSVFNESFAVAVETVGVQRWITRNGNEKVRAEFELSRQRRTQFIELALKYRKELGALYATQLAPEAMRERKSGVFAALQKDYQRLKAEWGGFAGYDRFFDGINNAHLASIAIYTELVPQFQKILAKHNGDLNAFYADVKVLAKLGKGERAAQLGIVAPAR